ncbi:MAG: signal peptidase I [Clostridium sp.]|nr:signal peptidase I [Clostridium sp.]
MKRSTRRHIGTAALLVAVVAAGITLRVFVGEICRVDTCSMEPAIQPTEILVFDKLTYGCRMPVRMADIPIVNVFTWVPPLERADRRQDWGFRRGWGLREPRVGDVAIFRSPENPDVLLVKRIHRIVEPGTALSIDRMRQTVEQVAMAEHVPIVRRLGRTYVGGKADTVYVTRTRFYDMRGDNTTNSYDSRRFGLVPAHDVVGRMGIVLWSWDSDAPWWNKVRWSRMMHPVK